MVNPLDQGGVNEGDKQHATYFARMRSTSDVAVKVVFVKFVTKCNEATASLLNPAYVSHRGDIRGCPPTHVPF